MLPGKAYKPDDFLWIAWTRKWFIVIPTVVIAAGVFIYARSLPNRYHSSALVLVIGQQVPKELVRPTVTDSVDDRLRAITQQIVSRTKLERIIEEFQLYKDDRRTEIMEDIVERMRSRDLRIDIPRGPDPNSFTVGFTSENPKTAMLVAERLASLFVQENTQNRAQQAGSTSSFLDAQVEDARRKLKEQDDKIAAFRTRYSGRLPTMLSTNLQMMTSVQAQIESNADAGNRERDRLTQLESKIADVESIAAAAASAQTANGNPSPDAPVAQQLEAARAALRKLLQSRRDDHPDVRSAKRDIVELEAKAEAEALAMPVSGPVGPPIRVADAERLLNLKYEMEDLTTSLSRRTKEDARLRAQLGQYTGRLESTPGVESEFTDLMRDYGTQREQYEDLLKKRDSSKLAENLEQRQIGEQFRVVDTARLPERPVSPNRQRMNIMGLFAGLAVGLGLVALLEYRDTTLKTDDDVITSLALPVIAVIPAMTNGLDRARQKRRNRYMVIAASTASVLLMMLAVAWKYRVIQEWVR